MIIRARHNFIIYSFFQKYTLWKIKRHFNDVIILGDYADRGLPILVVSNHSTWWDGFWIYYLNHKILKRKFYFIMLEDQLKKYWYFRYCGGYSIKKNSRSIFETLNYTAELLSNPDNLVLIFPQGEITSMHNHNIRFERGIELVMRKLKSEISILFVVNLIDYLSKPKPSLYQYISEYRYDKFDFFDFETSYKNFFKQSIERQSILRI